MVLLVSNLVLMASGCVHCINFFLPFFLFSTGKFPEFRGGKLRMVTPGHCIEEIRWRTFPSILAHVILHSFGSDRHSRRADTSRHFTCPNSLDLFFRTRWNERTYCPVLFGIHALWNARTCIYCPKRSRRSWFSTVLYCASPLAYNTMQLYAVPRQITSEASTIYKACTMM